MRISDWSSDVCSSDLLHHRPAAIDGVIGADAKLAALPQLGRDHVQRAGVHEAALGVSRLGPWIGMEQIDTLQRTVRQPFQHVQRIAHVDADVGQPSVADMPKRRHDAVQKGFAADETMAGMRLCLRGHMLTAAKADLEMHRRSEEHTSELQSLMRSSYDVFCLKKKKN